MALTNIRLRQCTEQGTIEAAQKVIDRDKPKEEGDSKPGVPKFKDIKFSGKFNPETESGREALKQRAINGIQIKYDNKPLDEIEPSEILNYAQGLTRNIRDKASNFSNGCIPPGDVARLEEARVLLEEAYYRLEKTSSKIDAAEEILVILLLQGKNENSKEVREWSSRKFTHNGPADAHGNIRGASDILSNAAIANALFVIGNHSSADSFYNRVVEIAKARKKAELPFNENEWRNFSNSYHQVIMRKWNDFHSYLDKNNTNFNGEIAEAKAEQLEELFIQAESLGLSMARSHFNPNTLNSFMQLVREAKDLHN